MWIPGQHACDPETAHKLLASERPESDQLCTQSVYGCHHWRQNIHCSSLGHLSQNHRIDVVGKDLWTSSTPASGKAESPGEGDMPRWALNICLVPIDKMQRCKVHTGTKIWSTHRLTVKTLLRPKSYLETPPVFPCQCYFKTLVLVSKNPRGL